MAGKKGRSGAIPNDIQTWCAAQNRLVALPKMLSYIQSKDHTPADAGFRWCVEQFAKMSAQYATVVSAPSGTTFTLKFGADDSSD